MKRTLTIFLITLSMLLVLGHAMVPHSHFFTDGSGISKPATLSFADLVKATFSRNLGTDHFKVFKGYASSEPFYVAGRDTPAILSCSLHCREFSSITIEKISAFPVTSCCSPLLSVCSLRAPPTHT